jgi:pimeloyl-ACP methyl ester carboxylesterase
MPREPMPDVVVMLPGILGSALSKNGRDVWAVSGGAALRALMSLGSSLDDLRLADDPPDVDDLGDGVTATRLLPDVHLIPYVWKIDGYTKVAETITAIFDVVPGQNYFEFPYDWRRDNRVAARRLARQGAAWLAAWRTSSGNAEAKLILVAHSMGGLVSRYFLEVLDGWRHAKALLTFGTPYRGSLNALQTLVAGVRKGPFGVVDLSAFVRSLTSIYQLLPIYPCYGSGGAALGRVGEVTGIPNVDASRAARALTFHREIEQAVERHLRDDAYQRARYRIFPIVGIEQPTLQSARLAAGSLDFMTSHQGRDDKGDGTVPRVSATPIELSKEGGEMFAATAHASLQNADPVLTHIHGALASLYLDLGVFRAPVSTKIRLGLSLDDAYWTDEPVSIRVRPERQTSEALQAVVTDSGTGTEVARAPLMSGEEWRRAEIRPLAAGVYRVTVAGDASVEPVTDVFAVFDRATA